jgi:cold shock CspA family protein
MSNQNSPLDALVETWDESKSYGSLRTSEGKSYLVLRNDIAPDEAGRQFLIPGEPAHFIPDDVRFDRAVCVTPEFREQVEIESEIVTVYLWRPDKGFGFAKREFGGELFVHRNAIISQGEESLKPGSKILCVAAPPLKSTDKLWLATQIEIFQESTEQEK